MYSMRNIYYALPISICNALPTPNSNSRLALTLVQTHQRTIYSTVSCSHTREKEFTSRWCSGNMLIGCTIGSHYITPVVGRLQSQAGVTAFLVVCNFSFTRTLVHSHFSVPLESMVLREKLTRHQDFSRVTRIVQHRYVHLSELRRCLLDSSAKKHIFEFFFYRQSTNFFILSCFSIHPNIFFFIYIYTIHLPNQ